MVEILSVLIVGIVFIVIHILGNNTDTNNIQRKYNSELRYIFGDIGRLKAEINSLSLTAKKNQKKVLDNLLLVLEENIEEVAQQLLLDVPKLNKGNEYKKSTILYKLKEEIENIDSELYDIEEEIISRER